MNPNPLSPFHRRKRCTFSDIDFQYWNSKPRNGKTEDKDDAPREELVILLPSLSFDETELASIRGVHHYEERDLFNLLLLGNHDLRLVFLSSVPIDEATVRYFLSFLDDPAAARERLTLIPLHDGSARPLTAKLLERPHAVARVRARARAAPRALIAPLVGTEREFELAARVGAPLLCSPPPCQRWGTKAGSRELFAACGVPHCAGAAACFDADALADAVWAAKVAAPAGGMRAVVVKLNESFAGSGNAILRLERCAGPADVRREMREGMTFMGHGVAWPQYERQIAKIGAIAEELIEPGPGQVLRSPSGQGLIEANGQVTVLSTHEQILERQCYEGATFPCEPVYRELIMRYTREVALGLRERGCLDHFSLDFVALCEEDTGKLLDLRAIEINLRKGGTTHPALTCQLLTGGQVDQTTGELRLPPPEDDETRCYFAMDCIQDEAFLGLLPEDFLALFDPPERCPFLFDRRSKVGVCFHLLGCLSMHGKFGAVSIAKTIPEARKQMEDMIEHVKKNLIIVDDDAK